MSAPCRGAHLRTYIPPRFHLIFQARPRRFSATCFFVFLRFNLCDLALVLLVRMLDSQL